MAELVVQSVAEPGACGTHTLSSEIWKKNDWRGSICPFYGRQTESLKVSVKVWRVASWYFFSRDQVLRGMGIQVPRGHTLTLSSSAMGEGVTSERRGRCFHEPQGRELPWSTWLPHMQQVLASRKEGSCARFLDPKGEGENQLKNVVLWSVHSCTHTHTIIPHTTTTK